MTTEVTFSLEGLKAKIDAIAAIDVQIDAAKGNAAKRRSDAEKFVNDSAPAIPADVAKRGNHVAKLVDGHINDRNDVSPVHALSFVNDAIAALTEYKRDADAVIETMVIDHLKATSSGSDETAALLEQRNALCTTATAMRTLFVQAGMVKDDESAVPAPKNVSVTTNRTNNVTTSGSRHYFKGISGRKVPAADADGRIFYANTAYSYLAFWADISSAELTAALKAAGVTSFTTPWEKTITVKRSKGADARKPITFTCGMVVDKPADK